MPIAASGHDVIICEQKLQRCEDNEHGTSRSHPLPHRIIPQGGIHSEILQRSQHELQHRISLPG